MKIKKIILAMLLAIVTPVILHAFVREPYSGPRPGDIMRFMNSDGTPILGPDGKPMILTYPDNPNNRLRSTFEQYNNLDKLLNKRFEINFQGFYNRATTLMCAILTENVEMVSLLLELGANPNIQDYYGNTALMYSKNVKITKKLLKYQADPNIPNEKGETPIIKAAKIEDLGIIKQLLKHGADPHTTDNNGYDASDYAKKIYDYNKKSAILSYLEKY